MRIVSNKPLARLLINSPQFLPTDVQAHTIETTSLLGPYFKLSPLQVTYKSYQSASYFTNAQQSRTTDLYFSGVKSRTATALADATRALRMTLQTAQVTDLILQFLFMLTYFLKDQLFQIVNSLIRVSSETRSRVLDWFARTINLNTKRTAMQVTTPKCFFLTIVLKTS